MSEFKQTIDYSLKIIEQTMETLEDFPKFCKDSVPHGYMDHALIYDYCFFEALTKVTRPDVAARAFPRPNAIKKALRRTYAE